MFRIFLWLSDHDRDNAIEGYVKATVKFLNGNPLFFVADLDRLENFTTKYGDQIKNKLTDFAKSCIRGFRSH